MFLLAVNLSIAIATGSMQSAAGGGRGGGGGAVAGGLGGAGAVSSRERVVWNEMRPSLVTLYGNGKATGVAALIDEAGYFVAHSSSVVGIQPFGTTSDNKQLVFSIVSKDLATSLVLLKTNLWVAGSARPFHPPTPEDEQGSTLIAVLPSGPLRMSYGSKHKLGVLNPSRRLVPLTEMRFETYGQYVGGALIFSDSGELIGSLNATLVGSDAVSQISQNSNNGGVYGGGQSGQGGFGGDSNVAQKREQYSNAGPSGMTVAYTVSAEFVQHVLEGFLSPSHSVEFAVLGVLCKDAIGGGALIQAVTPGSPADKSGLRPGDVLMTIGSNQIQDQVAFAKVMLQQKVGKKLTLSVQRGQGKLIVDIYPAKASD